MEELNVTEDEAQELLQNDPTPSMEPRYKTDARTRKARAAYMKSYRDAKKEEATDADADAWDARVWAARKENARSVLEPRIWLALGEVAVNQIGNLEQQVQSALAFQKSLGLPEPKPNQTYGELFQAVFKGWEKIDFPLLVIRANTGLNPNTNLAYHNGFIGTPLPGSDEPLPNQLPLPLGEKEWMESSEQLIRESEKPYRWPQVKPDWIFNPITGFDEPAPWLSEIPRRN